VFCGVMQQGALNTIAYGFNPQVQRELRKVRRLLLIFPTCQDPPWGLQVIS
jgi:hypothetical protein